MNRRRAGARRAAAAFVTKLLYGGQVESRLLAAAFGVCAGLLWAPAVAAAQPRVRVDGVITSLDYDESGKWLAVGYRDSEGAGRARVYRMKRRGGDHVDLPSMSKPVSTVAFLAEDKYLAIADEGSEVVVWSWPDLDEVFRANLAKKQGQPGSRFVVLGNPKGPQLAWVEVSAAAPAKGKPAATTGSRGKVEVAELPSGQVITRIDKVSVDYQAGWTRGGRHLLLDGSVWDWDTLASWTPDAKGVAAVSEDGARAASAPPEKCDGISIADLTAGKILRTIPTDGAACPSHIWFVDGDKAVVWLGPAEGGETGSILYRWDAKSDRVKAVQKGLPAAQIAVLAPSRRQIAIADARRVRFVNVR